MSFARPPHPGNKILAMLKRGLSGGVLFAAFCLNGSTVVTSLCVRPGDDLQAAVLNVREARKSGRMPPNREVRLVLGEGVYRLAKPLFMTEEDSYIRIEAEKAGTAILSGGLELPPFAKTDCGVWRTTVPEGLEFCQLWINGRFATRARMPNEGFAYMQNPCEEAVDPNTGMVVDQSKRAFVCEAQEAEALVRESKIGDLGNAFVRIYQMWVAGLHRIVSFNPESRVVQISPETERPTLRLW